MLTTLGLGSCVGIALYDKISGIIGLAHMMLPTSQQNKETQNIAKFADTAIPTLINEMIKIGAKRENIVAKIAGGAQMFSFTAGSELMRIGQRNIETTKLILNGLKINIISEDTGGNCGRTIELNSEDGSF